MSITPLRKTVKFTLDTSFKPGRSTEKFLRRSAYYVSGKHACPKDSREWLDTSLMTDALEQLLNLRVYKTYTTRNGDEVNALYDSLAEKMEAGEPLDLGSGTPLRNHLLYKEVLNVYVAYRENGSSQAEYDEEELAHAKALVIYQDHDGKFLGFQFLNDAHEDVEADEYIAELRRNIPTNNVAEY